MGFEQLAELKKQLAKQARDVKQAQREAEAERAKPSTGRRGGTEGRPAEGRPEVRRREDRPAAQAAEGKTGGAPGNRQRTAHDGSRQAAQGGAHPGKGAERRHGGQGGQGGQGGDRGERSAAPQGRQPRQGQHQGQQGQQQGRQPAREPVDPVVHAIGKLQKRFPAAFPKKPEPKLPLKVGIFEDLLPHAEQLGLSEAEIREAIATWCRGSRYWTCLTDGAARVDLNGAPAGVVNARDVAFARNSQRGGPRRPRAEGAAGAGGAAAATAKGEVAEGAGAEGSEGEAHSNAAPAVEAPVLAQPEEASGAAVEAQLPGDATAAATAPEQPQNHAASGDASAEAGTSAEAGVSAEVGASAEAGAEAEASAESTAQAASTDAAEAPNPATPGAAAPAAAEKAHANP